MSNSITLRFLTENDTADILRWRNSKAVRDYFIWRGPLTEEAHLDWVRTKIASGQVVQFIIEITDTRKSIGSVYLRDIDHCNKKAEFGIFIGEQCAKGCGYGLQATLQILKYAFTELKLNRVSLRVFSNNDRAIRCYRKAGFTEEGTAREDVWINGMPCDIIFMSILKKEWEESAYND